MVAIGTDHPTLPTDYIAQALDALKMPPAIAIGPAEDGGYYLLGMSPVYVSLFEGMTFSHASVFSQTMQRARQTDARIVELLPWFDVDEPEDLSKLWAERDRLPEHTARVMEQLAKAYRF